MKLIRHGQRGHERPGLVDADGVTLQEAAVTFGLDPDAIGEAAVFHGGGECEIADVTTYIRNSWGNAAPAVTPGQVRKARAAH